jgi:hypothetical protein
MRRPILWASLIAMAFILPGGDVFACGDKFLVASRGTRYQRPKNARAASIVIYANPSSDIATLSSRMESVLNRQGHHVTTVSTLDQLSAILSGSRFDVILAASNMAAQLQQLISGAADTAVVVAVDASPTQARLLSAIDKAVEQHDHDLRLSRTRS